MTYNWGGIDGVAANAMARFCPLIHTEDGFGPDEAQRQKHRRVFVRHALLSTAYVAKGSGLTAFLRRTEWHSDWDREYLRRVGIEAPGSDGQKPGCLRASAHAFSIQVSAGAAVASARIFTRCCTWRRLLLNCMEMIESLVSTFKELCNLARINEAFVRLHKSDLLVLNYHGVGKKRWPDRWSYGNCDDADSFRAQLRWLKQILEPTDLAGLGRWYNREWAGRKAPVLITFDDGYRNNLTVAAPILKEEGVPAVFFLATGLIGASRTLWNDEIRVRVLNWPEFEIRLPSGASATVPFESQARRGFADEANQACKRLPDERRTAYLEYLRSKTPSFDTMDDPEARAFMTWHEARELANMGFEVGSHTVEHVILSQANRGSYPKSVISVRQAAATSRSSDRWLR